MKAARLLSLVPVTAPLLLTTLASGQHVERADRGARAPVEGTHDGDDADRGIRRWALGLQVGPLDVPRGHLGVPFTGTMEGYHLAAGIVARWQITNLMALNAGVGLPQSGLGVSVWVGHEVFFRLARDHRAIATLEVYEDAGLTLGFAGPDYYARHEDVFVGYGYAVGGPLAFGMRFPVGLRVRWLRAAFDTYVEPVPMILLTPSVEALFELAVGFRIRL